MVRVRILQLSFVCAAIAALELLCRVGIIDRFTMIPPSEMAGALTHVITTAPWFWPDVTYTLGNLAAAIGSRVCVACSIRFSPPTTPCRPSCFTRC
jgi:ABC-type nitrate/sulfonate/bicarbonate transport system permease component